MLLDIALHDLDSNILHRCSQKRQNNYDAVYSDKDYAGESQRLASIIRERVPMARTLLDVACGTGRHIEYLAQTPS